ncbi:MAG: metallopeptidase TldD-related protein [bacterium]
MIAAQEIVESALAAAKTDGCVVIVSERSETNLRWANNSLTTNGQMTSRSVAVVSTVAAGDGTAVGVVSRSVASASDVQNLVRDSERAARSAPPADDAAPLVEPYQVDDDFGGAPSTTSVDVFAGLTGPLGDALRTAESNGRALFGFAEHIVTSTYLGSSTGLRRRFDQPTGRLELNAKSADYTRSAWDGAPTRDFSDVDVAARIDALNTRLDWAAERIDLPAGRYETLLPPSAVADLMIYLYWSAGARDADEGRSVFSAREGEGTRVGEQLSPLPVSVYSDPTVPGVECAPFAIATSSFGGIQSVFDNGAGIEHTDWLTDGVLTDLIRTRAWAERSGAEARPAVDNLIVDAGGHDTVEEMIQRTERGLLLTTLWYIREVDPQTLLLTGLTRDGVYLVENGEVRGAVNNFRFNESPVSLLGRLSEVGRSQATLPREWNDYFTRTVMPAMRIPDFNMSTVSAAS